MANVEMILDMLNSNKEKWESLKTDSNSCQDVTHENFITDVLWTIEYIRNEIEKLSRLS